MRVFHALHLSYYVYRGLRTSLSVCDLSSSVKQGVFATPSGLMYVNDLYFDWLPRTVHHSVRAKTLITAMEMICGKCCRPIYKSIVCFDIITTEIQTGRSLVPVIQTMTGQ